MTRTTTARLAAVLAMLTIVAACSDDGAPQAQAWTASPATAIVSDLPLGEGFDFYVLALSWSPAYCQAEGAGANQTQCASGRDLGFVVHGLWPQFESGYPEFCPTRQPDRVPSSLGGDYTDIVPSMGLIGHQWRKHGSCSGLSQKDYFQTLRAALDRITVPAAFAPGKLPAKVGAIEAEEAFTAANPGLKRDGIAIKCDRGLLREVRICLTPSLEFRACREVDRAGCKIDNLNVPAPG